MLDYGMNGPHGHKPSLYRRIWETPYGNTSPFQLFDAAKDNRAFVQRLRLQVKLPVHKGCVNTICWNDSGEYILSGSDDQHLCITNGYSHQVNVNLRTGHRANIFSAKFLPNTSDRQVISCSGDGMVIYTNLDRPETSMSNIFNCHFGTAYEIMTVPNDPHTFLSCGEDGTVRWFDLRMKNRCSLEECKEDVLISCRCAVTSLAVNPLTPYQLGVGCGDSSVRVFDRRMLGTRATGNYTGNGIQAMTLRFTVPEFDGRTHRITSLCYSPDGQEMLVSYSSDYIYLFSVKGECKETPTVLCAGTKCAKGEGRSDQGGATGGRAKSNRPLMKRLRVRGDWSDTGPNARPESEMRGEQQPRSLHASLMQRMSDVLTRMFTGPARTAQPQRDPSSPSSTLSPTHSTTSERDGSASDEDQNATASAAAADPQPAKPAEDGAQTGTEPAPEAPTTDSVAKDTASTEASSPDEEGRPGSQPSEDPPGGSSDDQDVEMTSIEQDVVNGESPESNNSAVFNQSLQNLEQELSTQRRDYLERHNVEPFVKLCYTGQSMNSGIITMGVGNEGEGTPTTSASWRQTNEKTEQAETKPQEDADAPRTSEEGSSNTNEASSQQQQDVDGSTDGVVAGNLMTTSVEVEIEGAGGVAGRRMTRTRHVLQPAPPTSSSDDVGGETPFMMEVERWDVDSSSDDDEADGGSRHEQGGSTSKAATSNVATASGNFMKLLRERRREKAQLMSVPQPSVKQKYMGHRNARTMIKEATFWGNDFVMSGSDCGYIFIWDRQTAELVMLMEGDQHVVNCLQPHPFDPLLASSGIDYDIKLWAPLRENPSFDEEHAHEIIRRNKVMLEETKDTITVPASFMIRMLASLNHLRSTGGRSFWRRVQEGTTDDSDSSNQ